MFIFYKLRLGCSSWIQFRWRRGSGTHFGCCSSPTIERATWNNTSTPSKRRQSYKKDDQRWHRITDRLQTDQSCGMASTEGLHTSQRWPKFLPHVYRSGIVYIELLLTWNIVLYALNLTTCNPIMKAGTIEKQSRCNQAEVPRGWDRASSMPSLARTKKKLSKADISPPFDFRLISYARWNREKKSFTLDYHQQQNRWLKMKLFFPGYVEFIDLFYLKNQTFLYKCVSKLMWHLRWMQNYTNKATTSITILSSRP